MFCCISSPTCSMERFRDDEDDEEEEVDDVGRGMVSSWPVVMLKTGTDSSSVILLHNFSTTIC